MNVLMLLIFISVVMVLMAVAFFLFSLKNEDFDHSVQLSLKPLEEDP